MKGKLYKLISLQIEINLSRIFHNLDSGFRFPFDSAIDTIKAKNKVKLLIPSSTSHHKQDRTEGMTIIKVHAKKTFLLQFLESL